MSGIPRVNVIAVDYIGVVAVAVAVAWVFVQGYPNVECVVSDGMLTRGTGNVVDKSGPRFKLR